VHYASGANPTEDDWNEIPSNYPNNDTLVWTPTNLGDDLRIRIKDSNSDLQDISGWYFSVSGVPSGNTSDGNEVINKTSDGNEVINKTSDGNEVITNSKMKKPGKLNW
jgi:hypothetical protein